MNKRFIKWTASVCTIAMLASLFPLNPVPVSASGIPSTVTVHFDETTHNSSRSRTVSIPNLQSVNSASVNVTNAAVSYSPSGNNVTVTVGGGYATSSTWVNYETLNATDYRSSTSNTSFPNTVSYSANGFSGNLSKSGSSYVWYTNSTQSSSYFTGSHTNVVTFYGRTNPQVTDSTTYSSPAPSCFSISSNGYSGCIPRTNTSVIYGSKSYYGYHYDSVTRTYRDRWTQADRWTAHYSGNLTKTVSSPVYRQNYAGTLAKGGYYNNRWRYTVTLNVTLKDTQAPSTPTLFAGNTTHSSIPLSWSTSTDNVGVSGYYVYRNGSHYTTVSGTSTTIVNVTSDTTYTFTVRALDRSGNLSASSNSVTVRTKLPPDTQAPSIPGNFRSTGTTTNTITLAWNASTDNVGVIGYDVYVGLIGSTPTYSHRATGTTTTVTNLSQGRTYNLYIVARDAAGNSRQSSTISETTRTTPSGGGGGGGVNLPYSQTYTIGNAGERELFNDAPGYPKAGKVKQGLKADVTINWSSNSHVNIHGTEFTLRDGNGNDYSIDIAQGSIKAVKNGINIYNNGIEDIVNLSSLQVNHSVAVAHDFNFLIDGYYKIAEQEFTITQTGSSRGLNFGYVIGINTNDITIEVNYTLYNEFYVRQNLVDDTADVLMLVVPIGLARYIKLPPVVKTFIEQFLTGRKFGLS